MQPLAMRSRFLIIFMLLWLALPAGEALAQLTLGVAPGKTAGLETPEQVQRLVKTLADAMGEPVEVRLFSDPGQVGQWLNQFAVLDVGLFDDAFLERHPGEFLIIGPADPVGRLFVVARQGAGGDVPQRVARALTQVGTEPSSRLAAEIQAPAEPMITPEPLPVPPPGGTQLVLGLVAGPQGVVRDQAHAEELAAALSGHLKVPLVSRVFDSDQALAEWFLRFGMLDLAVIRVADRSDPLVGDYQLLFNLSQVGLADGFSERLVMRRDLAGDRRQALEQVAAAYEGSLSPEEIVATPAAASARAAEILPLPVPVLPVPFEPPVVTEPVIVPERVPVPSAVPETPAEKTAPPPEPVQVAPAPLPPPTELSPEPALPRVEAVEEVPAEPVVAPVPPAVAVVVAEQTPQAEAPVLPTEPVPPRVEAVEEVPPAPAVAPAEVVVEAIPPAVAGAVVEEAPRAEMPESLPEPAPPKESPAAAVPAPEPVFPAEPPVVAVPVVPVPAVVPPTVEAEPVATLPFVPVPPRVVEEPATPAVPVAAQETAAVDVAVPTTRLEPLQPVAVDAPAAVAPEVPATAETAFSLPLGSGVPEVIAQPDIPQELRPPGIPAPRPAGRQPKSMPSAEQPLLLAKLEEPLAKTLPPPPLLPPPDPEPGVIYVVPFITLMVPPEVQERVFDQFVDTLNERGAERKLRFVIFKQGLDKSTQAWLQARKHVIGEIYGYVEESGCCSTDLRTRVRMKFFRSQQAEPALNYEYPVRVFFDHDRSSLAVERQKLADQIVAVLVDELFKALPR